jgi:hypothetical protein
MQKFSNLLIGIAAAGFIGVANSAPILYDFESGAQGWTVAGDATTSLGSTSIDPTWFLGTALPGSTGQALPSTWWINPNIGGNVEDGNGDSGAERSHVTSPVLIAEATGVSINFDSYSSNESGYPTTFDVEHVQISVNGGDFEDVHAQTNLLHLGSDQTFRNITFTSTGISVGDQIQYRFLYDTGDSCCGPTEIQGWAFDNVLISGFTSDVPEPASLALMSLGLVGFAYRRRHQNKNR